MTATIVETLSDAFLETFSGILREHWPILIVIFAILILGRILRHPSVKGWIGEAAVSRAIRKKLDPRFYRIFHDLYLPRPDGKGTTQIDHVVISPFGIFVIETKNMTGWISGSAASLQWTQTIYRQKHRFQNPLHQNALHVNALAKILELPKDRFHNLVVFVGDATLKTELPPNVMTTGLVSYIRRQQDRLIGSDHLERIAAVLEAVQQNTNKKQAHRDHVSRLQGARS